MLSLLSLGLTMGKHCCRTCESRGSKLEDVDDGAGMHGYLLCTILVLVVPAWDPKDRFMECVTM
jgi:hypothetical protein